MLLSLGMVIPELDTSAVAVTFLYEEELFICMATGESIQNSIVGIMAFVDSISIIIF